MSLLRRSFWIGSVFALVCGAASAQTGACDGWADRAQESFEAEEFATVETLVLECTDRSAASAEGVLHGYRLLALAYTKQGRMEEAQFAVLRLLATDYAYAADPDRDPTYFVALVETVREQLRVDSPGATASEATPSRTDVGTVPAMPPRVRIELPPVVAGGGVAPGTPETTAPREAAPREAAGRVNVNTASAADLQGVSGIGPALAERIVRYRTEVGPFRTVADLENVRGIGPRSMERLAPQVTVGDGQTVGRAVAETPAADPAAVPSGPRLDLNTATAEELDALPGIGPALAARILAYRDAHGPFGAVDDLLEVRGIGPKTLERFEDRVIVD